MPLVSHVYLDTIGPYYISRFVHCSCVINECTVFEEGPIIFCLYINFVSDKLDHVNQIYLTCCWNGL